MIRIAVKVVYHQGSYTTLQLILSQTRRNRPFTTEGSTKLFSKINLQGADAYKDSRRPTRSIARSSKKGNPALLFSYPSYTQFQQKERKEKESKVREWSYAINQTRHPHPLDC
jgi:hypothetical protein